MMISGVSSTGSQAVQGQTQATDNVSKNIQRQIADLQKQIQELSSNDKMSAEDKMKKRQELQKQISELNVQLRQHQAELRKEEQQKAAKQAENNTSDTKEQQDSAGFSEEGMTALISADSAMKQADVQGNATDAMTGRANVLEVEIQLDGGRGASVEAKQKELGELKSSITDAASAQMKTLGALNQKLAEIPGDAGEDNSMDEKVEKQQDSEEETDASSKKTDVKSYTADGKPVEEEPEAVVSVRI